MTYQECLSALSRLRKIAKKGRALEHNNGIRYCANQVTVMLDIIERRLELCWWKSAEEWTLKLRATVLMVLSRADCPCIRLSADHALNDVERLRYAIDGRMRGVGG